MHGRHGSSGAMSGSIWKTLKCGYGKEWKENIINKKVFIRISDKRKLVWAVRRRKTNCIGHILSKDYLQILITEGKFLQGRKVEDEEDMLF